MTKKELVVFDVDHTLFCCNLSYLFGKFLYKKGELCFFKALLLVAAYALHKMHLVSVFQLHEVAFRLIFRGKGAALFQKLAHQFISTLPDTFQHTNIVALLHKAAANGERVWLLSSSPDFLVAEVAKKWQVSAFKGTTYRKSCDDVFTQIDEVLEGQSKWQAIWKFLVETKISPSQVRAYTDSIVDLQLLEQVGEPIAVFPDKKLAKIARQKKWTIIQ
jgi:phosphoserine phosphatase